MRLSLLGFTARGEAARKAHYKTSILMSVEEKALPVGLRQIVRCEVRALAADLLRRALQPVGGMTRKILFASRIVHNDLLGGEIR